MTAFDLFSPAYKRDPYPTLARLRREAPVYAHTTPGGATIWYVSRYADATAVLRDDVHFCKDVRHAQGEEAHVRAAREGQQPSVQQAINRNMLFSDPPDHTRLRALVNQAFTPRRVEAMRPRVQAMADDLLTAVFPAGQMDLIAAYALPLPLAVISEMLGIPPADRQAVCDWSQAIIAPGSRGLAARLRRRKLKRLVAYLRDLFAQRQAAPADDLISALVQAEEAGDRLSEAELSSMVALLLVTGHETTVNLIGNGALALLGHPDQLALLREEPDLWATAVEELLRYDSPVETSTTRWVRRDVTFGGRLMRRGDVVRVAIAAANRDDACFAQPDRLDVQRDDRRHLSFGMGIHYCLGAPLARLEGQIALQTLFCRLPALRLAMPESQLCWRPGVLFRGLESLPLKWDTI